MSKATESALSDLHAAIAKVLKSQIEETATITDESGQEMVINTVTPATLGVAVKFLKDNEITASIEQDSNLGELDELLKAKREKRNLRLAPVTAINE